MMPYNTVIFGNLPYNISSQILIKFIKINPRPPNFERLIFMFQKEVGEKLSQITEIKIIHVYQL